MDSPSNKSGEELPLSGVNYQMVDAIQERIYDFRINILRKCYLSIKSKPYLIKECEQYPFIRQVLSLTRLIGNLTDEEKNEAIDAVLASSVYDRVKEKEEEQKSEYDYVDQLVKELLKWFKEEFFTWVNKLNCPGCGNKEQDRIRNIMGCKPYKDEHFRGKASIIERFQCLNCEKIYEFPRYNDIKTLLNTRMGRCGEWNNCFIAILRSLDIDVRYIWNAEDHVWCEYYSDKQNRWIHLDCCENSYDQPLLYNDGWAKKMSYVFAVDSSYIIDVTDKYLDITKPDRKLPRDKVPELYLQCMLVYTNAFKIMGIPRIEALMTTSKLIADYRARKGSNNGNSNSNNNDNLDKMKPRQSGGAEWTSKRGEAGN